jgi:hypothetical protein
MTPHARGVSTSWFLALALLLTACDVTGQRKLDDVSVVTAYIVKCDSVYDLNICLGPQHQSWTPEFTVVISRQLVIPHGAAYEFQKCEVVTPRDWGCFDAKGDPVTMGGDAMMWEELADSQEVAVSKVEYCNSPAMVFVLNTRGEPTKVKRAPGFWKAKRCAFGGE